MRRLRVYVSRTRGITDDILLYVCGVCLCKIWGSPESDKIKIYRFACQYGVGYMFMKKGPAYRAYIQTSANHFVYSNILRKYVHNRMIVYTKCRLTCTDWTAQK